MWKWFGRGMVVASGASFVLSYAGQFHPLGDSLAVFRPVLWLGTLASCVLAWRWRMSILVAFGVLTLGGWQVATSIHLFDLAPRTSTLPDVTLYQKNLLFLERDRTELLADIAGQGADLVTLQEVSRANQPLLEALKAAYPYQLLCNGHAVGAVAVLSRTPLMDDTCGSQPGFARAVTKIGEVDVQVLSLHLYWPFPFNQAEQVEGMLDDLGPLEGGVTIIGGDFNMVPSGHSVRAIEKATGTARVGRAVRTFELFGYPLSIDHVLATGGGGYADLRPMYEADHHGVFAQAYWPNRP